MQHLPASGMSFFADTQGSCYARTVPSKNNRGIQTAAATAPALCHWLCVRSRRAEPRRCNAKLWAKAGIAGPGRGECRRRRFVTMSLQKPVSASSLVNICVDRFPHRLSMRRRESAGLRASPQPTRASCWPPFWWPYEMAFSLCLFRECHSADKGVLWPDAHHLPRGS